MKHLFLWGYASGLASSVALLVAWKGVKAAASKVIVALAAKVSTVATDVATKV